MYIHTYIHIFVNTQTYTQDKAKCACVYVSVCECACVFDTHSRTLTCTHIHTHTYMFKHTHANTHPPTHKHTRTHIHIYSCSPGIISISPSGEGNRISSNSPSSICSRNLKRSDVAELEAPSRFFEYDTTHPQCQLPEYLINTFVCICIDMVWMW